jgi:hypothetical protein
MLPHRLALSLSFMAHTAAPALTYCGKHLATPLPLLLATPLLLPTVP